MWKLFLAGCNFTGVLESKDSETGLTVSVIVVADVAAMGIGKASVDSTLALLTLPKL